MDTSTTWFADDDTLVRELRRGQRDTCQPPNVPGYDNMHELRRGGQGVVFVATQASTKRLVAIKIVLDGTLASRESRRRFEREIDLVATLRHPNIVRVYDSGKIDDGRLYYIMEYIDGVGLDEVISRAQSSPFEFGGAQRSQREVLEMFAKICDGVQYAHQQGVIHRDLKPSNVRIDPAGQPHVLDFGLAKAAEGAPETTQMSRTGSFMGSLPWSSPEQTEGTHRQVDVRSDVYSLGVMLYQLLTGKFPYPIDGALRETLHHIQTTDPRPPREHRRDIGDEIATIAMKCLSKEPERRYQSAGELARDIRRHLAGEPIEAKRDSAWYSVRKTIDRYKAAVRAVSVLLVASLVFSAAMFWLRARAVTAEQLAAKRLVELETQVTKNKKVSEFLDTTLRAVDPWKHPGRDLGPLRELLDNAVKRLEGAFPDQPEVEAAIAGTLGWDYHELGIYDSAEKLLRRSYDLSRRTLGESHADTLKAMEYLGTLMTDCGRHPEAEKIFEELLAIQEKTLGPEHPSTLITLNHLALDLDWQGRSAQAEKLYRRALEAQTRILGAGCVDRLSTLNNFAGCLPSVGKNEEAEGLYRELIDIKTRTRGPDHPETLQARMNLAELANRRGRPVEAESQLRVLLEISRTALTPKHPLTIAIMHNLADTVSNLGHVEEALALARSALEAQIAFAGPHHPSTLNRKNELACSLIELKRWDEAIPLITQVRDEYTSMFGEPDWRSISAAGNLAFALNQMGKTADAERIWRRIISQGGPGREASTPHIVTARANLAALLADQKRWPEAEKEFRAALETQRQRGEADHWRTAYMQAGLGHVLLETHRLAGAKSELDAAYPSLSKALGDQHPKTQRVIRYLVELADKSGDAAGLAQFKAKLRPEVLSK
jgi:non-specific serine/threonine protein kinase/serine/threonine-protein kinase